MTWAGTNNIFYAENDVFTPGWNGIIHRVELNGATAGTNVNFNTGINDNSGVYFDTFNGQYYLYVNESQFGVPFGVNFVPTSNPFCVKVFEVNDVISSVEEGASGFQQISIFPNPVLMCCRYVIRKDVPFRRLISMPSTELWSNTWNSTLLPLGFRWPEWTMGFTWPTENSATARPFQGTLYF